jgi:UDP-N-acetylmuramate: L-alanyl-gamma-D-glutamyl-meso-diaminopimelate ligase
MGCWTPVEAILEQPGPGWHAAPLTEDGSAFEVYCDGALQGTVRWSQLGTHNVNNALAAIAAARHAGVPSQHAIEALARFESPKRRMEVRGVINDITVYDDFAHHPTAIHSTLGGLRARVGGARIIAVLEPRSNTMRLGIHKDTLGASLQAADAVVLYAPPELAWDTSSVTNHLGDKAQVFSEVDAIVEHLTASARPGDHVLIMSNGAFGGLHEKLLHSLNRHS